LNQARRELDRLRHGRLCYLSRSYQPAVRLRGNVGLPVVEYNFYVHRIVEGYYEGTGGAGAGLTTFDS
jgi:hypothetical protein